MPIQKLNAVPEITALPEIQPIQPLQAVPQITALPSLAEQNTAQNLYANYNDPYELNSFADAILNTEAIKKASEDWGWFSWVGDVPILREIGAAIDVTWNKGIKPAIQGDWAAVGINTLINLGETLGAPGNVVKGLLMEGPQGAWNALGLWNPAGRKNYDWNTGSWVADIGLEIITDPLTWISFGASAALSTGAKTIAKTALETTTKRITTWSARTISRRAGEQVTIDTARESGARVAKKIAKKARRTLIDYTTGAIEQEASRMAKRLSKRGITRSKDEIITDILNERSTQLRDLIIKEIAKDLPESAKALLKDTTSKTYQELVRRIDSVLSGMRWDALAKQINRTTSTLYRATNSFDKFLFQSTMYTSGLGLGYLAFKAIKRPAGEFINNIVLRNLRKTKYLTAANIVDIKNYEQARAVYSESYKIAKTLDTDVERSTDTFIRLVSTQFLTDRAQIDDILSRKRNNPAVSSRALDNYVSKRYGVASFSDYVNLIKKINELEEGYYNTHVQFLNRVQTRMERMIPLQRLLKGQAIRGIENLFSEQTVDQSMRNYFNTLKEITRIAKQNSENPTPSVIKYAADTQYQQIKYNELYRQVMLLKDPTIYKLITDIYAGSEGTVGALIKNILSDPKAYGKELYEIAKILNDTAYNVKTFDEFITDIYNGLYSKVERVSDNEFKLTLLDLLYSFGSMKAIDVISNPETIGSLLKTKLEEVFNARYKTGDKKRIYIPDENITIIQEQLLRYAETIFEQNPNTLLFYPLDETFTKNLSNFRDLIVRNNLDVQQIDKTIDAILLVYRGINKFNQEQAILRKNIFEENKALNASYDAGPINIIDSLTEGLEGTALYSVRQVVDTTNLNKYFNFEEGIEYSVNTIQEASKFIDLNAQIYSRLIDFEKISLKNLEKSITSSLDYFKIILQNIDNPQHPLRYLDYLKIDELTILEKISTIQTIYDIVYKNTNLKNSFKDWFDDLRSNNSELYYNLLHSKFIKKATVNYNPQNIVRSINTINFSDSLQQSFKELNAALDTEVAGSSSFKTFTESLKQRANNSALTQVCTHKNKIYNNYNNNVLNYTKNKINSLFDKNAAKNIFKTYSDLGFSKEGLDLLKRFLNPDTPLDQSEYLTLIEMTESFEETLKDYAEKLFINTPRYSAKYNNIINKVNNLANTQQKFLDQIQQNKLTRTELWDKTSGKFSEILKITKDISKAFEEINRIKNLKNTKYKDYVQYRTAVQNRISRKFKQLKNSLHTIYKKFEEPYYKNLSEFYNLARRSNQNQKNILSEMWDEFNNNKTTIKNLEAQLSENSIKTDKELIQLSVIRLRKENRELLKTINLNKKYFQEDSDNISQNIKRIRDELENLEKTNEKFSKILKSTRQRYLSKIEDYKERRIEIRTQYVKQNQKAKKDLTDLFNEIETFKLKREKIYKNISKESKNLTQTNINLYNSIKQKAVKKHDLYFEAKHLKRLKIRNILNKLDIQYPYRKIVEYNRNLKEAQDNLNEQQLVKFLSLSPKEMLNDLAFRARTGVIFNTDVFDNSMQLKTLQSQLNYKSAELKKLGVEVYQDPDTNLTYIYINKKHRVEYQDTRVCLDGIEVTRKPHHLDYSVFKTFDEHLYQEFSKLENNFEELTGFSVYGGTGEVLDKDLLTHIYNGFDEDSLRELTARARENGSDIEYYAGLPDEVKNNLPELDEILKSRFFDIPRYNDSILGTTEMRRSIQPYTSTNPITNAKNALEQSGIFVQPKYEFINNVMDSDFSIANGSYKNYSDAEILEGLVRTNGQYRLIALVEDKRWGMRIKEIQPLNVESIAEARRLNAVVVPYEVYTKMINTVNHRIGGSGFFKLWNRIMYLYKFGYLVNIGTIARNWIDTNLKTDLELNTEARGFKRMARDYIRQYKNIRQRVSEMNDGIVTRRGIERYFAGEYPTTNNTIDQETYFMLEDFFRFGPVTNISQESNLMNMGDGNLWRTFTDKTSALMSVANWTEASNRLAIYLSDLDKGIAKHDAWAHISKVHFDYSFKTPTEQLIESLFPFSTFMFRNIQYWVDMLERHPEYIPLFRDIYTPIWNFDERTPEELEYSWALQRQIINGSISLFETNNTEYSLRINPSIFDAIGTIVNPLTIIQNKLAAPITDMWSVLTGKSQPSIEMLPIIGTIYQRIDKAQREQNILPSLITKRTTSQTAPNYTMWRNNNLNNYYGIENTSNPYYVLPKTRMDSRIDPLRTIGTRAFTSRMMTKPKVKVDIDVYEDVYYRHYTNVYSGIRYQLMLNVNKFK